MFDLVEKKRGKETVIMTDTRTKVNDRLRNLRTGTRGRGEKPEYFIRESTETGKYRRKPTKHRP